MEGTPQRRSEDGDPDGRSALRVTIPKPIFEHIRSVSTRTGVSMSEVATALLWLAEGKARLLATRVTERGMIGAQRLHVELELMRRKPNMRRSDD